MFAAITLRFLVRIRAAIDGRTLLPPHLSATRFPQEKILQGEFPIAGRKRSTANATRDITVNGLRSGFGFDHLIKRVATWALKMECRGFDHVCPPFPDESMRSILSQLILHQKRRQLGDVGGDASGLVAGE
jgi:hypothetical protein